MIELAGGEAGEAGARGASSVKNSEKPRVEGKKSKGQRSDQSQFSLLSFSIFVAPFFLLVLPDFSNAGVTAGCCRDSLELCSVGRDDGDDVELPRKLPTGCVGVVAAATAPPRLSTEKQSPRQPDRRRAHPARRRGCCRPRRRLRGHEEGAVSLEFEREGIGPSSIPLATRLEKKTIEQAGILSLPPPLSLPP